MTDYFSTPDDTGDIRQSDLQSSLGERLVAQGADALDPKDSLSGMYIWRRIQEGAAAGFAPHDYDELPGQAAMTLHGIEDQARSAIPDTSIEDAKARVKQEGLGGHITLPDQPSIKSPVLDLMINEAHERRDRDAAIARGPQGFIPGALGLVTSLGAGMMDPVNMAAFSIPVLGEARWGKLLASAGDSILARTGVRALEGGVQGAVGTAVLQPADWWLHTQDGQDYTMADALKSVVMGAGMGAVFHAGLGGVRDVASLLRGRPLAGSPDELASHALFTGRDVAPEAPEAGEEPPSEPITPETPAPAAAIADLPPAAKEDAFRSTVADIAADRPARTAEMLDIAADHDPRIAESVQPADEIAGRIKSLTDEARGLGSVMDIAAAHNVDPEAVHTKLDNIRVAGVALERDIRKKYGVKAEDLEDAPLTDAERHFLFYEESPVDRERISEITKQLQPVDSLDEASREIAYEFKRLPKDTDRLDWTDRLTVMRLQVLFSEVGRLGGDLNSVLKKAGQKYAARFEDPEDALFMAQNAADRLRSMFTMRQERPEPGLLTHGDRLTDAAADPRFRQLADARPAEMDPDVVAESREADRLPEPASLAPESSLTAAEKAAADAEEVWRELQKGLSDDERELVNSRLDQLKDDKDARDTIISDGVACLVAAVG